MHFPEIQVPGIVLKLDLFLMSSEIFAKAICEHFQHFLHGFSARSTGSERADIGWQ